MEIECGLLSTVIAAIHPWRNFSKSVPGKWNDGCAMRLLVRYATLID